WHRRDRAQQDRVVPVHESRDADGRLFFSAPRVIAGPFPERPLIEQIVGMDKPLESDLRVRRNRQPSGRPLDPLDRLTDQTAGDIVFVLSVWALEPPHHEQGGMHARHPRDRTRLAALVVTPFVHITTLLFDTYDV